MYHYQSQWDSSIVTEKDNMAGSQFETLRSSNEALNISQFVVNMCGYLHTISCSTNVEKHVLNYVASPCPPQK